MENIKMYSGILNVNKPPGITSRKVLNQLQANLGVSGRSKKGKPRLRIGHAGTLDPLATGVLVVCIGKATKLIQDIQKMPKTYVGTFLFGRFSDTEDIEGQIIELPQESLHIPSIKEIHKVLPEFIGKIQQVPPVYSALKINGERSYKLAREGKMEHSTLKEKLKEREITVYDIQILEYEYPKLVMQIKCGSGTYIRSLGRDIAQAVETKAIMSDLIRTEIGCFNILNGISVSEVNKENIKELLLDPEYIFKDSEI